MLEMGIGNWEWELGISIFLTVFCRFEPNSILPFDNCYKGVIIFTYFGLKED
ncbi:hypothetical protein BLFGPEAP_02896 [Candidatus Methanoperedenaceae archaeon GB50]|nr:hypothetical protein BLFGPEAP_02896 [Candidatus Methanoperedenaceae archaeon GB50]